MFRSAASLVAATVIAELEKPENREKLAAAARDVVTKLRDPDTAKAVEDRAKAVEGHAKAGVRALGRAYSKLKNR